MPIPLGDVLISDYQDPAVPGRLGPVVYGEHVGRRSRVTITKADLVSLWSTRRVLIPAPGPGKFIIPGPMIIRRRGRSPVFGNTQRQYLVSALTSDTTSGYGRYRPSLTNWAFIFNQSSQSVTLFLPDYVRVQDPRVYINAQPLVAEDTPLVLLAWIERPNPPSQQDWESLFAGLDPGPVVKIQARLSGFSWFELAEGTVDANGALQTVTVTRTGLVFTDDTLSRTSFRVLGGGSGAVVTPVRDSRNILTGFTIDSAGSGYVAETDPTTLTFDVSYEIWTP